MICLIITRNSDNMTADRNICEKKALKIIHVPLKESTYKLTRNITRKARLGPVTLGYLHKHDQSELLLSSKP
jgi:hypothetical protein